MRTLPVRYLCFNLDLKFWASADAFFGLILTENGTVTSPKSLTSTTLYFPISDTLVACTREKHTWARATQNFLQIFLQDLQIYESKFSIKSWQQMQCKLQLRGNFPEFTEAGL